MEFVILAEGHTEAKAVGPFFKKWLDAQDCCVAVKVVRFEGCKDLLKNAPKKARMYLDGPRRASIIGVIGLMDLAGSELYPLHRRTAEDRYNWAVKVMEKEVDRENFRMFCAVHELEAWLLSDPSILPLAPGKQDLKRMERPEKVNFHDFPSRLLKRLYRAERKNYKKTVDGPNLFDKLDPEIAREKCPYLKIMLDEMLKMAKQAGC